MLLHTMSESVGSPSILAHQRLPPRTHSLSYGTCRRRSTPLTPYCLPVVSGLGADLTLTRSLPWRSATTWTEKSACASYSIHLKKTRTSVRHPRYLKYLCLYGVMIGLYGVPVRQAALYASITSVMGKHEHQLPVVVYACIEQLRRNGEACAVSR